MLGRPFFLAGCICLLSTAVTLYSLQPIPIFLIFLCMALLLSLLLREFRGRVLFLGLIALLSCLSVNHWQEQQQLLSSLNNTTVSMEGVITDAHIDSGWIRYEAEVELLGSSFPMDLSSYDMELLPPGQRFQAQAEVNVKELRWQNGSKILEGRLLHTVDLGADMSISSACLRIRSTLLHRMDQLFTGSGKEILSGILFGEKVDLSPKIRDVFQKSGCTHLLTVSGFHISLIIGGLFTLINRLGFSPKKVSLLLLPLIPLIALVEGSAVSIDRAAIMAFLYYGALILEKEYDGLSSWGLAVLITLLTNPAAVRSASFLLSYSAVLSILLFQPPISAWFRGFLRKKYRYDCQDLWMFRIISATAAGLSANILISPFLMIYFGSIPLLAPLSSLLLIPILPTLMGLTLISILCPINLISQSLAAIAQLLAAVLYRLLAFLADLDLVFYGQNNFLLLSFLLFLAMLLLLYVRNAKRRIVCSALCSFALLFISLSCLKAISAEPQTEVIACRRSVVLCQNGSAVIIGVPERQSDWDEIEKILHCSHVKQVDLLLFSEEPRDDGLSALNFCENWSPRSCQSTAALDAFDLQEKHYVQSTELSIYFWDQWEIHSAAEGIQLCNPKWNLLKTHKEKLPQTVENSYDSILLDDYALVNPRSLPWGSTWAQQPKLSIDIQQQ